MKGQTWMVVKLIRTLGTANVARQKTKETCHTNSKVVIAEEEWRSLCGSAWKESNNNMVTLEEIVSTSNLMLAKERVRQNKGAPGIDGLTCEDLNGWFEEHSSELTSAILDGTYKPLPIRRVYIPKDNGEKRPLGIPSVIDRVVQQAIAQVLSDKYDESFSESSFGFRPNIGAREAVNQVNKYLNDGYTFVVDLDLAKFFDTVNHSKILRLLSDKIKDGRVISLINKILRTKIIDGNQSIKPKCGLTQGAPCSPVLANILLDLLDKELERRGHKFARYADDMIILCRSRKAAERTYKSIKVFIERKLLLKINSEKSKVGKITSAIKFLGFGFYKGKDTKDKKATFRPIVHSKSKQRLVNTMRTKYLKKNSGHGIEAIKDATNVYLMGWTHYFVMGITKTNMKKIEAWIRRKIRALYLKSWKRNATKEENFIKLKTSSREKCHIVAHSSLGIWAKAKHANYIITNKVIHQVWGWMNISDIAKTKAWVVLGH